MNHATASEVVAPGILSFTSSVRPGPGVHMATRSLAIQLGNGEVSVYSPVAFSAAEIEQIESLGRVTHLVAPNLFHHLSLPVATTHWPAATVWGPEGLETKCPNVGDYQAFTAAEAPGWPAELQRLEICGMPTFREWVLLHAPTNTLIVADLIFNQPAAYGASSRFLLWLTGGSRPCNVSRLFRTLIRDREAFAASCRAVIELPFERVIMAHGQVIDHNAKAQVSRALARWLP